MSDKSDRLFEAEAMKADRYGSMSNVMGWNLVRSGSQISITNGVEKYPITIGRVEELLESAAIMVRDAKHWKERGE